MTPYQALNVIIMYGEL